MTEKTFNVGDKVIGTSEYYEGFPVGEVVRKMSPVDWAVYVSFNGTDHLVALESLEKAEDPLHNPISPGHYSAGMPEGVEVRDIIKAQGWWKEFCAGNSVKYVLRWQHKNGVEDLKKARQYIDWLIEELEK